ncbi:GIY-YIG nuclease family protein [Ruficoccus sp. ZRK36]|uniref:GIY-YIG nuclease family protein n=1 Tax=Ruficoccus sp. ZRK36 TaxID=2866311 RepID=UPI001C72CCCB|nr:GIY-YIG nuclease family protein [Ruficoccus sp. ZRK36]QYY36874.1 GIY-YIG nuclease family protein [Ruficoccus sp. ZRK36]
MLLREIPRFEPYLRESTKLVRHIERKWDVRMLIEHGQFDCYQNYQVHPVFHDCSYILSFLGEEQGRARFIGLYKKTGVEGPTSFSAPSGFPYPQMFESPRPHYMYAFEKLDGFRDLEGRLVIDWGGATLSWHQWFRPRSRAKEVAEISPVGYVKPFPGYEDFVLTYRELRQLVAHPQSNREWYDLLSSVAGVYLILDIRDGKQYVGSAYGEKGLWGRWATYAKTGHGGNKLLAELCEQDQQAPQHFRFTVLRTLPRTMAKNRVIAVETLYKEKLGSRAYGLNASESKRG